MQKYRVYTDDRTHAKCILEDCEAKVCSFKDSSQDSRYSPRNKQAAFCVEHHNQLADLKVRSYSIDFLWLRLGRTQYALHLENALDTWPPPLTDWAACAQWGLQENVGITDVLLVQLTMWYKLINACLQASGGKERLNQLPTRVVCPHCLEAMTLKEAMYQGHFIFVSCTLLSCAPTNLPRQPLSLKRAANQPPTSRGPGLRGIALPSPLTVCMALCALQKYRPGTTDQLQVSKPNSKKGNCGVTHSLAPAKKARIGGHGLA